MTQAQDANWPVARLLCFDAKAPFGGGWAAVITQVSAEKYPADIFVPDENGNFAEKFPMFEDIYFSVSVFENTQGLNPNVDTQSMTNELLLRPDAPPSFQAEGNRVGTALNIKWEGSGSLQYDTKDQEKNFFVSPSSDQELKLTCSKPFIFFNSEN